MIVTVIHKGSDPSCHCVCERELRRAYRICLNADTEDLGLNGYVDQALVVSAADDLIDRVSVSLTGTHSVTGDILCSVAGPDIHNAGVACLASEILGDADTSNTVSDPEVSDLFIGAGKGKTCSLGVREEGGVEIETAVVLICELYPSLEVTGLDGVSVDNFAVLGNSIVCVNVYFVSSGDERKSLVKVCEKLVGVSCASGVVTCGLDTARKLTGAFKSLNIVCLPTVHRNADIGKSVYSCLCIYAIFCIYFLCGFVSCVCHFYLQNRIFYTNTIIIHYFCIFFKTFP